MEDRNLTNLQSDYRSSYDKVADEYATRIYDELQHKPFDRELLDLFTSAVVQNGKVCDIGCGPGQITRYLHDRGVDITGIDLSPEMVRVARRLNSSITFSEGNMLSLNMSDASVAGITAFYSIIHLPRPKVIDALREMQRVLMPGGLLLLAFHVGSDVIHFDEWWGNNVSVDFFFFPSAEMTDYLSSGGFNVEQVIEREPYPEIEHQSRRSYILATKSDWKG